MVTFSWKDALLGWNNMIDGCLRLIAALARYLETALRACRHDDQTRYDRGVNRVASYSGDNSMGQFRSLPANLLGCPLKASTGEQLVQTARRGYVARARVAVIIRVTYGVKIRCANEESKAAGDGKALGLSRGAAKSLRPY